MVKHKVAYAVATLAVALGIGALVPIPETFAEAAEYSVGTFEGLIDALDSTWEEESGEMVVKFTGDISQTYGEEDYLGVNSGWNVTLDLNGHTLTLRNDGARGFQNMGTLTITGNGTITNGTAANSAYGLIDNYGDIVVENGHFIDYGQGNGSSIKSRPGYGSSLTIESGTFEGRGVNTGNACIYSDGDLVIKDGVHFTNASNRAYAVIVGSGTAVIGDTVGNSKNPVVVDGTHGALGINGGTVVVNNGVYTAANYYGIWITNNNNISNVTINYGDFTGGAIGKNALRASVDDGKQDASDATITVRGGKFTGNNGAAAVAVNKSGSEHSWGMAVSGGEFSTELDISYVAEGYDMYDVSQDGPYYVEEATEVNLPAQVFLQVGESYEVGLSDIAKKYGTFGGSGGFTIDGDNIVATGVGKGIANFNLHNYVNPVDENIEVVTYEVTTDERDDAKDEAERDVVKDFVAGEIEGALASEEEVYDNGKIYIDNVSALKAALAAGKAIIVSIDMEPVAAENVDLSGIAAGDKIGELMSQNEIIAGAYEIEVNIWVGDENNTEHIGRVYDMGEEVVDLEFELPEGALAVRDGYTRVFYVTRGHVAGNGQESAERVAVERDGNVLKGKNSKFSTFVISYVDIEEESEWTETTTGGETTDATTPETGTVTAAGASAMSAALITAVAIGLLTSIVSFAVLVRRK